MISSGMCAVRMIKASALFSVGIFPDVHSAAFEHGVNLRIVVTDFMKNVAALFTDQRSCAGSEIIFGFHADRCMCDLADNAVRACAVIESADGIGLRIGQNFLPAVADGVRDILLSQECIRFVLGMSGEPLLDRVDALFDVVFLDHMRLREELAGIQHILKAE